MKEILKQAVAQVCRVGALCLLCSALAVTPLGAAQKKKKSTRAKKAAATQPAPEPTPVPLNLSAEAAQVTEQIKLVTRFLYVYGKVVNRLELAEEQIRQGELTAAKHQQSREAVVSNLNGLRTGMENLAARFQANPRLQVQYLKISYAAEAIANAERLAANDRFDESGKSLVQAVERLAEVLQAMR